MKRAMLFAVLLGLCLTALPALAQGPSGVIILNDATPAIDVVITLPADTTGTIALDFVGASVRLTDSGGNPVFTAADPRLHGLELNIAPNSGSHTLTVERLPGFAEASVQVRSSPELTTAGTTELVDGLSLTLNQEVSLPLNIDHPGDTVTASIPADSFGALITVFPGAGASTQLTDAAGVVLAESNGGQVDGVSFVLDSGDYQFTLLGSNLVTPVVAGVRALSANDGGFTVMQAPADAAQVVAASAPSCAAVVAVSAANLRSGPGTGYSVLGYGYRGQSSVVGGRNPEDNWLVVETSAGPVWISSGNVVTQGDCANLTVFNIPLQEAQPAPFVIVPAGQSGGLDDETEGQEFETGEVESGDDD